MSDDLVRLAEGVEARCRREWDEFEDVARANRLRVLSALARSRLTADQLEGSHGYGYDDAGRQALERAFAEVMGAEAALVRPYIVSGTHAIAACLAALSRPGGTVVVAAGTPYDTLLPVLGLDASGAPLACPHPGSLPALGVRTRTIPLGDSGSVDRETLRRLVADAARDGGARTVVLIQRSSGYAWRDALSVQTIAELTAAARAADPRVVVVVDNCYGEFVECEEPTHVGADLIAGSLIKNPGGGLAMTGGYVAGRADLVEAVADRLTAPGLGSGLGATVGWLRGATQGLFLAPLVTGEALCGAAFAARVFAELGLETRPLPGSRRADIVQAVKLGSVEALLAFCRGVQEVGPVGAGLVPEPAPMPGYGCSIIMAGATFVQGATSELSVDAPLRPPFVAYLQGGIGREHSIAGVLSGLERFRRLRGTSGLLCLDKEG